MRFFFHKWPISLALCLGQFFSLADTPFLPAYNSRDKFLRIGVGPAMGFYSLKSKHATAPTAKIGFNGFVKKEWSMDRSNKVFFSTGLEASLHRLNYKSYYFSQDTLQLYDGEFAYLYRLSFSEIAVPLQMKFTFKSTSNSLFTPYISVLYHLRYITSSRTSIDFDGTELVNNHVDLKFRNPVIYKKINASVGLALGIQSNITKHSSMSYYIEILYRYGFSHYHFDSNYSASSVYINSTHLSINFGIGF